MSVLIVRTLMFLWLVWLVVLPESDAFVSSRHLHVLPKTSLALATSSSPSSYNSTPKKTKKRNPKPRQKILQATTERHNPHTPTVPPPDLTKYAANASPIVNVKRQDQAMACPHFGLCSGCVVDQRVADTAIIKSAALYFSSTAVRQHRADVLHGNLPWAVEAANDGWLQIVVPSPVAAWRTQAKLAVAPHSNSWVADGCTLGLYKRASHDVLPIPNCVVHHPSINRAVQIIEQCTKQCRTAAFDENSRQGGLRYVQLQVERSTGKVCCTLVWHASQLKEAQPALSRLLKALQQQDDNLWHSIWCHCNDGTGNAIFHRNPRRWHRLAGPEYVRDPLPTASGKTAPGWLYFTPQTFRQGNMDGFSLLAVDVAQAVPPKSKVCELYAGVGLLGLTALAHHHDKNTALSWIRCSDENPANSRCFARAVDSLPASMTGEIKGRRTSSESASSTEGMTLAQLTQILEKGNDPFPSTSATGTMPTEPKTSYMVASAAQALKAGQALGANVLIVDPPRRGLEDVVLDELCKPFNPKQPYVESASLLSIPADKVHWTNDVNTLIYVSCGFDALARDTERLLASRAGWVLQSATGYVLFPGSDHVETVCVFQRQ